MSWKRVYFKLILNYNFYGLSFPIALLILIFCLESVLVIFSTGKLILHKLSIYLFMNCWIHCSILFFFIKIILLFMFWKSELERQRSIHWFTLQIASVSGPDQMEAGVSSFTHVSLMGCRGPSTCAMLVFPAIRRKMIGKWNSRCTEC